MTSVELQLETRNSGGRILRRVPRKAATHAKTRWPEGGRRVLNIIVALVGIALAFPLMVVIATIIRLTSRGPIIFKQVRVGLDRRGLSATGANGSCRRSGDMGGRPFTIYKFRTMRHDGGARETWASPDDPRITLFGRFLRKTRLDELPQLFNVLMGDMNIVGPRPEQPTIFQELREQIPEYGSRQLVRPGITGWAQVNQHYDTSIDDVRRKVNLDLEYIRRQSVSEDLRIMLRTLPVIIFQRGAW